MMRIDTPQQLAFVETKGERVIRLARAWLPRGFLACEHYCHAIEDYDDAAIDRLVACEHPCPECPKLGHPYSFLPLLPEARPGRRHPVFAVQASAGGVLICFMDFGLA